MFLIFTESLPLEAPVSELAEIFPATIVSLRDIAKVIEDDDICVGETFD